jgi:hypothetical protein
MEWKVSATWYWHVKPTLRLIAVCELGMLVTLIFIYGAFLILDRVV